MLPEFFRKGQTLSDFIAALESVPSQNILLLSEIAVAISMYVGMGNVLTVQ